MQLWIPETERLVDFDSVTHQALLMLLGAQAQSQDLLPGLMQMRRLTAGAQWTISAKPTHPSLVTERDFVAARLSALSPNPATATIARLLVGLLRCGLCGRSLESEWSHGNHCYRCRSHSEDGRRERAR